MAGENPPQRVLEIGTGSGYQAAVLARLVSQVYSVERIEPLIRRARERLIDLGLKNIELKLDDGYIGWEEQAPFDAILVTAAPERVPERLIEQLVMGGRMVIPVGRNRKQIRGTSVTGGSGQELLELIRTPKGVESRKLCDIEFVPMVPGGMR